MDALEPTKPELSPDAVRPMPNPDQPMRSNSRSIRESLVARARAQGDDATQIDMDVLTMDEALIELEPKSASAVRAFELHYFGELDTGSIALRMGKPPEVVRLKRKLASAVVTRALKSTSKDVGG